MAAPVPRSIRGRKTLPDHHGRPLRQCSTQQSILKSRAAALIKVADEARWTHRPPDTSTGFFATGLIDREK